jgi:hypothetical protein
LCHRDALRARAVSQFSALQHSLKQRLARLPRQSVSIALDESTDRSQWSYLSVMAHFVEVDDDGRWHMRTACLDMIPNVDGHAHAVVRRHVIATLQFYGIEPLCIMTDNGSNLQGFGSSNVYDVLSDVPHLRCLAHVVQLAVRDILRLSTYSTVMQDVETVVAPFRSRRVRAAVVEQESALLRVTAAELDPGCAPTTCCTRWSSDYDLLDHFCNHAEAYAVLSVSSALDAASRVHASVVGRLRSSARSLQRLLSPLAKITTFVQCDTRPVLGAALCFLRNRIVEWGASSVLLKEPAELRRIWRRTCSRSDSNLSRVDTPPTAVSSSSALPARVSAKRPRGGCTRVKRPRRRFDTDSSVESTQSVSKEYPYACPNGTIVVSPASNSEKPTDLYTGRIGATLPDGSVQVLFYDGDVEVRPASDVKLYSYRSQSDVPLSVVYSDRAASRCRFPRPPDRYASTDVISDLNTVYMDSSSDSESSCAFHVSPVVDRTEVTVAASADTLDWLPESGGCALSSDRQELLRRAAAHMVLLAGPMIRAEEDVCALGLYFCPASAYALHRHWGAAECAAIRGRAHAALIRLLEDRLPRPCTNPSVFQMSDEHAERNEDHAPDDRGDAVEYVTADIVQGLSPCASEGCSSIPLETHEERCSRVASVFMGVYEDAAGVRSRTRSSAPTKHAHEWWTNLMHNHALVGLEPEEMRHLLCIVRAHLAVPASSASCERSFSTVTRTRSSRPAMKPDLMRYMVFLKYNSWVTECE